MAQIVRAYVNSEGNYVLEVKPLPNQRVSNSGLTVQVAGTIGWPELLHGVFIKDPEGNELPAQATVHISFQNPFRRKPSAIPLTMEDLKKAIE